MPHSKTPGGQAASAKFQKQQAESMYCPSEVTEFEYWNWLLPAKGLGADNAPGHTEGGKPGDAPVAGDSYASTVGVDKGTNQPGESGNVGQPVGHMDSETINQGNLK